MKNPRKHRNSCGRTRDGPKRKKLMPLLLHLRSASMRYFHLFSSSSFLLRSWCWSSHSKAVPTPNLEIGFRFPPSFRVQPDRELPMWRGKQKRVVTYARTSSLFSSSSVTTKINRDCPTVPYQSKVWSSSYLLRGWP